MSKTSEPVLIQAFIPEFSDKALDVAILHWFSRLDQLQLNAMAAGSLIKGSASVLPAQL